MVLVSSTISKVLTEGGEKPERKKVALGIDLIILFPLRATYLSLTRVRITRAREERYPGMPEASGQANLVRMIEADEISIEREAEKQH